MTRLIKSTIAALALACFAAPVAMAQPPKVAFVTVDYGDLDISQQAGAQSLLKRIHTASKKICGTRPATTMNGVLHAHLACRTAVVSQTVKQINQPGLTLAWQAETGATVQTAAR